MKKIILSLLLFFSFESGATNLSFYEGGLRVRSFHYDEIHLGYLAINGKQVNSQTMELYNPWRKYKKSYVGYDLFKLLDSVYGRQWRVEDKIIFKAIDGYRQVVKIKDLLMKAKGKTGLLSYKEKKQDGFTTFKKGEKLINPGPYYLLWSGFDSSIKVHHKDVIKWPYQLKEIVIR